MILHKVFTMSTQGRSERYIIVHELSGEVVNAFTVEDAGHWPPVGANLITMRDDTFGVGDIVETSLSRAFKFYMEHLKRTD
jgi:hypothetical protein